MNVDAKVLTIIGIEIEEKAIIQSQPIAKHVRFVECSFNSILINFKADHVERVSFEECQILFLEVNRTSILVIEVNKCKLRSIHLSGLSSLILKGEKKHSIEMLISEKDLGPKHPYSYIIENVLIEKFSTLNFEGKLEIVNSKIRESKFFRSQDSSDTHLYHSHLDTVYVESCSGIFRLTENLTPLQSLQFIGPMEKGRELTVYVSKCLIEQFLCVGGVQLHKVEIENTNTFSIVLGECCLNNFRYRSGIVHDTQINLELCKFDDIHFAGDLRGADKLHINNLRIFNGQIHQGVEKALANISLSGMNISNFIWEAVTNKNQLQFSNVNSDFVKTWGEDVARFDKPMSVYSIYQLPYPDHFTIINSDLGKINFISCDFYDMLLDCQGTKLTEIFVASSRMPRDVASKSADDRQFAFAQLKKVFENMGDTVTAHQYQQKELNAHLEYLKDQGPELRFERWALYLNKYSNRFGTDWWLAAKLILGFSTAFFLLYVWSAGYIPAVVTPCGSELEYFVNMSSYFLEFVSPIHKVDFMQDFLGENFSGNAATRFFDSFIRIINGYLIYQMVQAFRKHGKK